MLSQKRLLLENADAISSRLSEKELPVSDSIVYFDLRNMPFEVDVFPSATVFSTPRAQDWFKSKNFELNESILLCVYVSKAYNGTLNEHGKCPQLNLCRVFGRDLLSNKGAEQPEGINVSDTNHV